MSLPPTLQWCNKFFTHQLPISTSLTREEILLQLQQTLNERLLQAADAKTRGNQFFQARRYCEALAAYLEGMDLLGASEHAKVLLSARLEGARHSLWCVVLFFRVLRKN